MSVTTKTKTVTKKVNSPASTVAPTGMSVTRSGNEFTVSWKVGDSDYGAGQWVKYQVGNGKISSPVSVHTALTSYTVTKTATGVGKITFWVQGKRKKYQTSTSKTKTSKVKKDSKGKKYKVKTTTTTITTYTPSASKWTAIVWAATAPAAPTLEYTNVTSSSGTFSWSANLDNSGKEIFKDCELQTVIGRNNSEPGSGWSSSSKGNAGDVTYTETMTSGNLVRWVRIRSRGPGGNSAWVTKSHAYGNPASPILDSASAAANGNVLRITANFRAPYGVINQIDTITVQYVIAIPTDTSLSAPSSGWADALTVGGNAGTDRVIADVSEQVGTDKCMWVRLKATHDGYSTYSNSKLVSKGALDTPGIDATPNASTGYTAITITENTDCNVACTAIFYRSQKRPNYDQIVAILPRGTTSTSVYIAEIKSSTPGHVTRTCFGAYAFVGTYSGLTISAQMKSGTATDSDILAVPPAWLSLSAGITEESVRIRWPWTWTDATITELSWADHSDAWESTDDPNTYDVEGRDIASWIIAKLTVGKTWYFRARFRAMDGDEEITGPWSGTYTYNLSSVPDKPALILSKAVIGKTDSVTARWAFASGDKTTQKYAEICLATVNGGTVTYGSIIAKATAGQTVDIKYNWTTGTTYYLCLRVTSTADRTSAWSEPVRLFIAPPIQMDVTQNSLVLDDGTWYLQTLPLTVTVTGAGDSGQTVVSIARAEEYHVYRPDDSEADGYEGENIATHSQDGEDQVSIGADDLVGALDDGAKYILICTVNDEYGQSESVRYPFTVAWTHQAGKPKAEVRMDDYQRIAIIKPIAPDNYEEGDVCDIYRISSDKPELVVQGAEFGTEYVDPYPAFGSHCGHRIVTRTANGDYITEDNQLAWFFCDLDIGDVLYEESMIIDVNGEQIDLPFNIELQNSWKKDFKRTSYLGGSVQGDWNPAVTRDVSANTVIIRGMDLDTQLAMRNLAGYAGPAHIRTPEGSSMSADIQVRESWSYQSQKITYALAIQVIDPEVPDGMTYEEWVELHPPGEVT